MTKSQKTRFKKVLEAKRGELLREIGERRQGLAIDTASDPMDQVRNLADRDFAVRGVDRLCRMLRQVEGALRELRENTYGVCARCEEEIPLKRLEAVPWSPFCVSCQERLEHSAQGGEWEDFEPPYALAS